MKLTKCKCSSSNISLLIDMDLSDPGESECCIRCNECGRAGKICIDVEDAIDEWKETDAAEIDNKEMQNRLDEMDSIFNKKILTPYIEPDRKYVTPGIYIRDEMDNFGPDGEEMRSLAAKSFSTYSNNHAWANKTGREILKDIEKLSDAMGIPAEVRDMKFGDGNSPSEAIHGFQELREYEAVEDRMREKFRKLVATGQRPSGLSPFDYWPRMLAKPFDMKKDQDRAEPEPPRGLTTEKIDWIAGRCGTEIEQIHVPTPGTVDIHFKGENPGASVSFMNQVLENKPEGILVRFHEMWTHVPYKPDGFFDVEVTGLNTDQDKEINELAEKCEASGLASKEETICAIKAMENKCVNAAEAGEKMRDMCKVAMKNGTQLGHTESVLMNVEAAVGIPVDTEKYPHKCDCGSACYDNGFKIKCMNSECNWYDGGKS